MKEWNTPSDLKDSFNESDGVFCSDDLDWFAGVFDAEGSIGHRIYRGKIICTIHFGMTDKASVVFAKNLVEYMIGCPVNFGRRLEGPSIHQLH